MMMATAPLDIEFVVACTPEHAFTVWTSRISAWWPLDHTVTAEPGVQIFMETGVGGRIFERSPDGREYLWGEITGWDPPRSLAYRWHLRQDRADATEVAIAFVPLPGAAGTRIHIEHTGWERLGDAGVSSRQRNDAGWSSLLPHFKAAVAQG